MAADIDGFWKSINETTGKPQCAVCGLGEALVGLALVERGSFDNKSTVVSFNLLLGTSGKNFSLSGVEDTEIVPCSQACSI